MELAYTAGRHLGVLEVNVRNAIGARLADDRGEGVISMAIAILVIATIGAAMYLLFDGLADDVGKKAEKQVEKIGG